MRWNQRIASYTLEIIVSCVLTLGKMSNLCFSYCFRVTAKLCALALLILILVINSSESYYFRNGRAPVPPYFRNPGMLSSSAFRYPTRQQHFLTNRKRSLSDSPSESVLKQTSCTLSTKFVHKLEKLIAKRRKDMKLWKLWQHWKNRSQHCGIQSRASKAIAMPPKEEDTGFYHDKNIKSIVTLTGVSGILSSAALLWLSYANKKKPKFVAKPKKRLIQHLHIHPPFRDPTKPESEPESKSKVEESDKQKAAVKIGLAREILAINAESIHLSAHILEFLFIMTKIARALNNLGMPAPLPKEGNKILTPDQAQSLIQMIEKEGGGATSGINSTTVNKNSLFSGIGENPLGVVGKNVTASAIFQGALKNPAALGLQSLFSAIGSLKSVVKP